VNVGDEKQRTKAIKRYVPHFDFWEDGVQKETHKEGTREARR